MTIRHHALLAPWLLVGACAAPPRVAEIPRAIPEASPPIETPAVPEVSKERDLAQARGAEIWAYNAWWMGDAWRTYDLAAFGRLLFFDLEIARDGRIENRHGWPERWEALRAQARRARVPLDPVVTLLTNEAFTALFSSPAARTRLLSEVTALARGSGGVHLDIEVVEGVQAAELESYRRFVEALRKELDRPPRKILTAFVSAINILYDARSLALLDAIVAQGYDVHWKDSARAGPPAMLEGDSPAAWRTSALALSAQGVSSRKVLFSTPLYGYEWPTVSGEARAATRAQAAIITYAPVPPSLLPDIRGNALSRAAEHGLRRETATGAPWYAFRDRDGWRQGWFDDAVSLAPRLDFVQRGDYLGVALFVLGYDGGALLESIQARFRGGSAAAAGARPAASR